MMEIDKNDNVQNTEEVTESVAHEPAAEITEKTVKPPIAKIVQTKKVELSEAFSSPIPDNVKTIVEEVPLPSDYNDNLAGCLEGHNPPSNPKSTRWGDVITSGAQVAGVENVFISSLQDESSDFKQGIKTPAGDIAIETSKLKRQPNQVLEGEKAVMMVRNMFGLGSYVRIPLIHSGFWVNLKAPSEGQLLELHRQLTSDKIELGRTSYGLAFSNQNVFFVSRLYEFVKSCIHSHSIKTDKDISNFIHSHDLPILIWGLACSVWPNGFSYSRGCLSDPSECHHVVTETLNLNKLLWINNATLNAWQKSHMMSKGSASMTEDDVVRYRKELLNNQSREVKFNHLDQDIVIKLKVPTVMEWISQGTMWINNIVETVTTAISATESVSERNNHMIDTAKASALRQYSHWVESISFDSSSIEDRDTINDTLAAVSADDDLRDKIIVSIQSYIDDTVIGLVGIPSYDCPACKTSQDSPDALPKFVNIIPLEVYTVFFILIMQRVSRIKMR